MNKTKLDSLAEVLAFYKILMPKTARKYKFKNFTDASFSVAFHLLKLLH